MLLDGLITVVNRVAPLAKAIRPVLEGLESRRLLSADAEIFEESVEEPLPEEWMELTITSEESSGDLDVFEDGGEIPEEWLYLTIGGDGEEGSEGSGEEVELPVGEVMTDDGEIMYVLMYKGDEGEVVFPDEGVDLNGDGEPDVMYLMNDGGEQEVFIPDGAYTTEDGEEIYYLMIEGDGNVVVPEEQDLDGDGVPDYILYTTTDGNPDEVTPISAPVPFVRNGKLIVRGTGGDDTINVKVIPGDPSAGLSVTINGEETIVLLDDVNRIRIAGGNGNDTITIDENVLIDARIQGQGGDDQIKSGAGNDIIGGGDGDDNLHGGKGQDRMRGNKGADEVAGGGGKDELSGGRGVDLMKGGRGDDALRGGKGKDRIRAGKGNDLMDGGAGLDKIMAGEGIDGCQDEDDILDPDADDAKLAEVRLAKPFWWTDDGSSNICLYDPENPDAECDDTPSGDAPIWWEPGDPIEDDVQGIDVGEPYPDDSKDGDRLAYDPDGGLIGQEGSDTEDPYAGLEEISGTLVDGVMAIGGETTGYMLVTAEGKEIEVSLAGLELPEGAVGSQVTITGRFADVEYIERGTVTIMVADGIEVA